MIIESQSTFSSHVLPIMSNYGEFQSYIHTKQTS